MGGATYFDVEVFGRGGGASPFIPFSSYLMEGGAGGSKLAE
jgi:hypothetical protein